MTQIRLIFVTLVIGLVAGCATPIMTERQCRAGDWFSAGREDGAKGRLESAFDARAAACAEFGISPDVSAYNQGRDAGILNLCTESGGFNYGRRGLDYLGVCPAEWEPAFLDGYLVGRRVDVAERVRDAAQSAYNNLVYRVERHYENLRRARRIANDPDASEETVKAARKNARYHRQQINYLEPELDRRLYELGRADAELDAVIASAGDWRRSDAFALFFDTLTEAHNFARAERGILYCTDELPGYRPMCAVRADDELGGDEARGPCIVGPGELRFVERYWARGDSGPAHRYEFYPFDANGKALRRSVATVTAQFSADGAYRGVSCAG